MRLAIQAVGVYNNLSPADAQMRCYKCSERMAGFARIRLAQLRCALEGMYRAVRRAGSDREVLCIILRGVLKLAVNGGRCE